MMGDFFHGWRRKTGVATLVLALAFTGGWFRSDLIHDAFGSPIGKSRAAGLLSAAGQLGVYVTTDNDAYNIPKQPAWKTCKRETFRALFPARSGFIWSWHYHEFGMLRHSSGNVSVVIIPYWSIVLPMSLLSAYLLLIKPRSSSPKNVVETVTAAGA